MSESDPLIDLLPSLVQCFGVIFIGYLSVRLNLITSEANAIGTYVTKFALPALFFRSMATINFTDVNWTFILAIAVSKFTLFIITIFCTIVITRPINFGKAGIFSMFITQSNDVALGYPILLSLYPDLAKYIYLFAPAQLIIINPMCFLLLECHEYRITNSKFNRTHISPIRRIIMVLKNILFNPLIFMTVIGAGFNLLLSHRLPLVIDKILQILAESFAGVALFYLGMNMVGKIGSLRKTEIYLLVFLLLGKLVFLPFLTREIVVHLLTLPGPSNQSLNYTLVAFLYGGLPTAPPVFLIAKNFHILPDLIATGLVIGTFISGPLMFITARVITTVVASKTQFDGILKSTAISISGLSLASCIWVILLFLLSRRCKSPIHRITICYAFFVIIMSSSVVVGRIFLPNHLSNQTNHTVGLSHHFQFSLFFIGCVGARVWTVLMAVALMIFKRKGVCYLMKNLNYFYVVGFSVPVTITTLLILISHKQTIVDIDPSFQYGSTQLITSLIILGTCIIMATISLVLEARSRPLKDRLNESSNRISDSDLPSGDCDENRIIVKKERRGSACNTSSTDIDGQTKASEESPMLHSERKTNVEDFNIQRHLILVLLLIVTMFFGLFLCLWRLIKEEISGIYIELEFLDCVFNFGQGFILWMLFGLDMELMVIPFKKKIMAALCNLQEFNIPPACHLSTEEIEIRDHFLKNHLDNCRHEITRDIRYMFKLHTDAFSGKHLIDWIIQYGLANNRSDAIGYGQVLIIGKVVEHIKRSSHIIDDDESFYRFIDLIIDDSNHTNQ